MIELFATKCNRPTNTTVAAKIIELKIQPLCIVLCHSASSNYRWLGIHMYIPLFSLCLLCWSVYLRKADYLDVYAFDTARTSISRVGRGRYGKLWEFGLFWKHSVLLMHVRHHFGILQWITIRVGLVELVNRSGPIPFSITINEIASICIIISIFG